MIIHVALNLLVNAALVCSSPAADKPVVMPSIQAAYDYLKAEHEKGNLKSKAEIVVHGGSYVLEKPLCFDSDFPVTIRNYEKEKVEICGGKTLAGWQKTTINGKSAYKVILPENVKEVPFLFVNGKLATPARWPKKGYFRVTDECPGYPTTDANCDRFHINKGDFNPKWHDPENILIHMLHYWIDEPLKFKSFDEKSNTVKLASYMRYVPNKNHTEYCFLNVREALSEPGEYYFDRKTHELLLIPEKDNFEAVIPVRETLVRFAPGAKNITLSGLDFKYGGTHWPRFQPELDLREAETPVKTYFWGEKTYGSSAKKRSMPSFAAPQGSTHVPGVILFQRASNCAVKNCTVTACSWYGIQILEGCRDLAFSNNEISGMGGGGFLICGGNPGAVEKDPSALTSRIVIRKNHIHDCGLFFHSAIGILIAHACGCVIDGNHIHDLYYSGVSCGWTWGYGDAVARENSICRNHIHDLGKGLLSDMGGIYLLGIQPGTHVYENRIHDIVSRYYGGWGLYTDEGSSHIVLERNLVYDCACEGFHQHFGRENIVRFNIFAFNKAHGLAVTRDWLRNYNWPGEPHSRILNIHNNVILTDGTPAYGISDPAVFEENKIFTDNNIIFDLSGKEDRIARIIRKKLMLPRKAWQEKGNDRHSVFCDPGFIDAGKRDFRLKEDSILLEYGFDFLK